jgi:DNA-binding MarR family transcriptional regulator
MVENYQDCVVFLLAKAYQNAHGALKRKMSADGLTPVQYLILEALWQEDGVSAGEIGRRLRLDSATLSGILERLAENGWIVKEHDPTDKRALVIRLSDRARSRRSDLAAKRDEVNEEVLAGLNVEERILLRRLLRDIRG